MDSHLDSIRFSSVRSREIGGVTFVTARLTRAESGTPVIYTAALSEDGLRKRHWRRGYGTTVPEAIAALLNGTD